MISNSDDSIKKIEQGDLMEDERGEGVLLYREWPGRTSLNKT